MKLRVLQQKLDAAGKWVLGTHFSWFDRRIFHHPSILEDRPLNLRPTQNSNLQSRSHSEKNHAIQTTAQERLYQQCRMMLPVQPYELIRERRLSLAKTVRRGLHDIDAQH